MLDGDWGCATWDDPALGRCDLLPGGFKNFFLIARRRLSVSSYVLLGHEGNKKGK